MVEDGYLGMNMASLAKRVGWAKGTLTNISQVKKICC